MHHAVTGSEFFRIVRYALRIHLDIAVPFIKEDADLAGQDLAALLHPDQLSVMIDGLHAVAADIDAEVRSRGNVILVYIDHLKSSLIDVVAGTGGSTDRRNWHLNDFFALVGVGHLLDMQVLGSVGVLRTAVIFFYLSNEGVSLLENAAHLGLPIPAKLKAVLEQLHDRAEKDGENDEQAE